MCRSIHELFNFEPAASDEEVHAAALQYVRKVTGHHRPSRANEQVFVQAVDEIADATYRLLEGLVTNALPRDREVLATRARIRAARRYGAQA